MKLKKPIINISQRLYTTDKLNIGDIITFFSHNGTWKTAEILDKRIVNIDNRIYEEEILIDSNSNLWTITNISLEHLYNSYQKKFKK